ncbi:MAG: TrkA C-terminal domain-containing protein [Bacilli bacterium]|nr:TrkA C-terminal domain-containing protein [Bacilli bacterium]
MGLIASVILILSFIVIYVVVIQIYSVLFRITGLTKEKARFQAISLLTNSGFTTTESEIIVSDRVRRRIAIAAMINGYAFSVVIVSLIINVILSLKEDVADQALIVMTIAFAGFVVLIVITQIPIFKRLFEKFIQSIATKLLKRNKNENIVIMLDNYGRDSMAEVHLNRVPEFMVDTPLEETRIKDKYHLNVLMLKRSGKIVDVNKDTIFKKGDQLVVFGSNSSIANVFTKRKREQKANSLDLIEEYGEEAMVEIQLNIVPEILKNKGLFESGLKSEYSINLLTIKRKDVSVAITKDTTLQEKDVIVVFGPYVNIKKIFNTKQVD